MKTLLLPFSLAAAIFAIGATGLRAQEEAEHIPYTDRPEVREFAVKFATKHAHNPSMILAVLAEAEFKPRIIELMDRAPEGTWDWGRYKKFVDEDRISRGAQFWDEHKETLLRAEEVYGVPPEIVLGILAMETRFGRVMGSTRILDALMTLGFDYPRRASFFRRELEQFLLMSFEEGFAAQDIQGSYAGAMGYGQFMPSSYRRYATDFDGDGVRDLLGNVVDAIGSTASYLAEHGWVRGEPLLVPALAIGDVDSMTFNRFGNSRAKDLDEVAKVLMPLGPIPDPQKKVWPVRLVDGQPMFFIAFDNFHAITRYNHSRLYSMAVVQLARKISRRHKGEG